MHEQMSALLTTTTTTTTTTEATKGDRPSSGSEAVALVLWDNPLPRRCPRWMPQPMLLRCGLCEMPIVCPPCSPPYKERSLRNPSRQPHPVLLNRAKPVRERGPPVPVADHLSGTSYPYLANRTSKHNRMRSLQMLQP